MTDKEKFENVKPNANEDALYYAKNILAQLKQTTIVFWSWGGHDFQYGETADEHENPFLQFKVSGMKFKGTVRILYNWADYYEVEFYHNRKRMVKRINECYCDNFVELIDEFVEKQPDYVR